MTDAGVSRDSALRDPSTRVAVRASLLLMMLISVSAQASVQASVRGFGEISHATRIALQHRLLAEHLLPASTALPCGFRFESSREPLLKKTGAVYLGSGTGEVPPCSLLLFETLLNLPPPLV